MLQIITGKAGKPLQRKESSSIDECQALWLAALWGQRTVPRLHLSQADPALRGLRPKEAMGRRGECISNHEIQHDPNLSPAGASPNGEAA